MDKQVVGTLAVAVVGLVGVVHLTVAQLRGRLGDSSHQRRGVVILSLIFVVLWVLDSGLRGTSFKPEPISFWVHMAVACLTVVILIAIAVTGFMAKPKPDGATKAKAARAHCLLNKPAGKGALLWLSASIMSGTIFVIASLVSTSRFH